MELRCIKILGAGSVGTHSVNKRCSELEFLLEVSFSTRREFYVTVTLNKRIGMIERARIG